ncbi:hypothetical protein [Lacrimispora sp.]|uniref:hypothetical protein n=1 Tax=Lacrimispora sp. TaxID=2719234 RepID=UPI00289DB7AC|nr:hypothetical protein [Lacrimispora sp.]
MSIRIVILGDGISGQLFLNYLKYHTELDYSCIILDKREKAIVDSIDDVPFYFNNVIEDFRRLFVPIKINMGIYDRGKINYQGTDYFAYKYSMKILGHYSNNTVRFIKREKQAYIIRSSDGVLGRKMTLFSELHKRNSDNQYFFNSEVIKIDVNNKILYTVNKTIAYDLLVSTIPLNVLNKITNQCPWANASLNTYPFYINRLQVKADNKYKVLYCTDNSIRFSRMAKLNDTIFLESRERIDLKSVTLKEQKFINYFLNPEYMLNGKSYMSYPGRFEQLDDDLYNKIEKEYRKSGVFLLGRMATWQFKLVENIYDDCREICEWIKLLECI